jgi:hydroxyacylglutathione hydrolase
MEIRQIWINNKWRNFNYLVACSETGEALAIDPLDHEKCLAIATDAGWDITRILNTHEHGDHTGGNQALKAATGAEVIAHHGAANSIPEMDRGLAAGDVINVGKTVELQVLDTPGHTMCHVCVLAHGDEPALFCGDTLFNAGAGNCHNGGHPEELYQTFSTQLQTLDQTTRIFPGHDYITNNLEFTLDREPGNQAAKALLDSVRHQDPAQPLITTLELEKEVNTFFRLGHPAVIARLKESFDDLPDDPDMKTVFLRLRELRNSW